MNSTANAPDADPSDPACATTAGVCRLRAAIQEANATAGDHTIAFTLPDDGDGVPTITLGSSLPDIQFEFAARLLIDGYTQPGAQPNTNLTGGLNTVLKIELDCNEQPACLSVSATGVTIRGLVVNNGNGPYGCLAMGRLSRVVGVTIEGNFFGTDPTGTTKRSCGRGVFVTNNRNNTVVTVGGTTPAARNLISGCGNDDIVGGGIFAAGLFAGVSLTVQGNLIGTDRTGTQAIPNTVGIVQGGAGTDFTDRIGGDTPEAANVISGNSRAGIEVDSTQGDSIDAVIQGNLIGTDVTGTGALGNGTGGGVFITNHRLGHGRGQRDRLQRGPRRGGGGGGGVRITANSIHANGQLGIDLQALGFVGVVEANDDKDADTGANNLQNFPLLDTPVFSGGPSVMGTLNSTPDRTFRIEVFANDECDPALNGEGQTLVGTGDTMPTDSNGDVIFTAAFGQSLAAGTLLTATATNLMTEETSEFSPCPVNPTTTTTTSSTTSTSTTATTTLPSDPCAAEAAGPTFRSLDCRLAAMLERVRAAAGQLGPFGTRLPKQVAKAKERTEQAEAACREPNLRRAKGRLARGIRRMIQIGQTLNSGQARRSMDRAVREALHAAAVGIRTDMRTLRGALRCPEDTPGVCRTSCQDKTRTSEASSRATAHRPFPAGVERTGAQRGRPSEPRPRRSKGTCHATPGRRGGSFRHPPGGAARRGDTANIPVH